MMLKKVSTQHHQSLWMIYFNIHDMGKFLFFGKKCHNKKEKIHLCTMFITKLKVRKNIYLR